MARELLGKCIVRHHKGMRLIGRIVETEAYRGALDPAAHTFRGKTKRNEVMYWGGRTSLYLLHVRHALLRQCCHREKRKRRSGFDPGN
ncbi:MAG: DNA-3-methyladenine glycosylase [Ignavibacteriales bacterium]|nr:DNA-3-methyladenine glycosylase [Ignavibacteriales bacterium]